MITFTACQRVSDWDIAQFTRPIAHDIWFDADVHRVFADESDRDGGTDRTTLHPLYGYFTYPPLFIVRKVSGVSGYTTVRCFHASVAGAYVALFFFLLRLMQLRRLDAVICSAALVSSSSAIFWFPVPETFVLGGMSILPALVLAAAPAEAPVLPYQIANILGIGVTVTNWLASLLVSWLDLPMKKFLRVVAITLGVTLAGGLAYSRVFPNSKPMFEGIPHEAAWIFAPESGGPFAILRTFFISSMITPEITMLPNFRQPAWPLMTMQFGRLFSGTGWSYLSTTLWAILLIFGLAALFRLKEFARLRTVLGVTLLYELLLHLLYGRETFLYSMHYLPLMVLCVALACHTRWRRLVLALTVVMTVGNFANNVRQFAWAREYAHRFPVIQSQEDEIARRVRVPRLRHDPSTQYRFFRDVWPGDSKPKI